MCIDVLRREDGRALTREDGHVLRMALRLVNGKKGGHSGHEMMRLSEKAGKFV